MLFKIRLSTLFLLFAIYSCNESSNENTDTENGNNIEKKQETAMPELKIGTLSNKRNFIVGETPVIKVSQVDTLSFDSIQFYFQKELVQTSTVLPIEVKLTNTNRTGNSNFEAKVFANSTSSKSKYKLKFLSDIEPKVYSYEVVRIFPHDQKAYTQGLVFEDGFFYEATGIKGESSIRKVQVGTGDIIRSFSVSSDIFGEGITLFGDKLIQLSWRANVGFVYDKETFQLLSKFDYPTEGWGLTHNGKHLIMSDGTNKIHFLDNQSYTEISFIEVYDNKGMVDSLNELEFIDGEIYANLYQTDKIARIDPETGKVLAYIDLTGLLPQRDYQPDTDVLNGIAYDSKKKKLFVTGKRWPKLFEIKLTEK